MTDHAAIPRPVIRRMPQYLRHAEALERQGVETVSSAELGAAIGSTAAQVRKDLACFGQLGRRGVGYVARDLARELRSLLSLDRPWRVALVGAGNIGRALCTYRTFRERGFRIVALFDSDPFKDGCTWAGLKVQPMRDLRRTVRALDIDLGIIAVPAPAAQGVALVPKTAVRTENGATVVYIVRGDTIERREVRVGGPDGDRLEALSGLRSGDQVVLSP